MAVITLNRRGSSGSQHW